MNDELASLVERLEAISEDLSERALTELAAALRTGRSARPARERTLTQARRAVDKAVHLLRTAGETDLAPSEQLD